MLPIKAASLGYAHELAVKQILEKGKVVTTQDGELTLEVHDMIIEVDTPYAEPMVSPYSNFKGAKLQEYVEGLIQGKEGSFTYTYHGRLFHWKLWQEGCTEIDQIEQIIKYLNDPKNRDSRRAIAITWYPGMDLDYSGPCLQLVQFLLRGGALHMSVVFRSNDMLSALGANMFALVALQAYVAARVNAIVGNYTHHSISAHAYVIRDQKEVEDMAHVYYNKLVHLVDAQTRHGVIVNALRELRPDVPWKM